MDSSVKIGSTAMDSMDSHLPEHEFLSLQAARKVSFKVKSGDRFPRVSAGISVSPATPVFQSDYCKEEVGSHHSVQHALPCSAIMSSVPITIPKLDSELNNVPSDEGVLASSNICCEGLDSDAIGCHLDSDGFIPAELLNVQFGNLSAKESEADLLPGASLCVPRQGNSDSSLHRSQLCSLSMNSSAIIGSRELDSMDSLPPEREFLSLQVAKKMSYKVKSEDRGPRVSDGISVSPASISVQHAMPCSSPVSSVSMAISKSYSKMNEGVFDCRFTMVSFGVVLGAALVSF
ncbi:hypothetical protein Nepgr_003868 [Nepenthes gracilis]|uniref:Uncharacterized protein n=1 Tax=Nepenthes gracilis TaxID=150966 RepID=A0AAD3S0F5_NEPGR|nr:hypothetical protein Nepgr_003868 [Nepenthes gracilis]